MKLLRIIAIALIFSSLPTYTSLNWVIVTSENDNPGPAVDPDNPKTLRDAIEAVNGGAGTDNPPNAIAFANNVQTITLQANLPLLAPVFGFVLIDGLAIANLNNPQSTIEGDCSMLPSPVDDPQGFSESIRITIDGSGIPDTVDPTDRYGFSLLQGTTTIRGIRIQNITAPGSGSRASGIAISDMGNVIECCELRHIQNTAYTTSSNDNKAVGIECNPRFFTRSQCGSLSNSIAKCYVHHIEGGSIANCDGTLEALQSGHAYGILNCECIEQCRIENIASGSINATCNNDLRATVGRSAGIANGISDPGSPTQWPCQDQEQKTGAEPCPINCDQNCQNNPICIRDTVVCTITGGSITTGQPEVFVLETAGMLLGSPFSLFDAIDANALIQNNIIACVQSGNITVSGNNTKSIAWGAFGIVVSDIFADTTTITCNTIDTIQTGSTTLTGTQSGAFPGYTIGIWNEKNQSTSSLLQCNIIKNICGATAFATGTCSILSDDINTICSIPTDGSSPEITLKHTPGGPTCAPNPAPVVAGIRAENISQAAAEFTINNNTVQTILGGKRVAQGADSIVSAIGSTGIYINSGDASTSFIVANQNNIQSVSGAELIAQAGSAGAIKTQGTSGLCALSLTVTATENLVTSIREGSIRAAQNTLGINLTQIFFGVLDNGLLHTKQQLEEDNSIPYAPVITSGIVISSPRENMLYRSCANQDPWCIADNTVTNILGSSVTGSTPQLGSIAAGIWLQPLPVTPELNAHTVTARSFESCAAARQNNETNGTAFNNQIHTITAGTCAPAYGIFLDGSAHFFNSPSSDNLQTSIFFTLDQNSINAVCGDKTLPLFDATLSAISGECGDLLGSLDIAKLLFPFLPFEPTSGIYTLFGGCSTINNNTIGAIKALRSEARGITTAASSDMLIFENTCSNIQGSGIFVGGAIATIDRVEGLGSGGLEAFASVRNKIYTNSTFNNTKEGIDLGLVDWSNTFFGIELLNVCPGDLLLQAVKSHQNTIVPEDSVAIFGNHGQPAPEITKVVCNSNGTITIEIDLQNTHPLTNFIIQFFRNSTNAILHGEQAISNFNDALFVFTTDFNGRAIRRFTFVPLAEIQRGDNITAHVTVSTQGQAAITDTYFCDTSEFGGQAAGAPCPPTILGNRPQNKPSLAPGFATLLHR